MADISGQFEVDGLVKQREELEHLLMSDPAMEKRVQALIRKVLLAARREIGQGIKFDHGDPRQAYKAVKTAVYRQILGGSVNLYNKRHASGKKSRYEPPRKLRPGRRGGNRMARSSRTQKLMDYEGADRAFVLRFINEGTDKRTTGRGGKITANRGAIAPRNFFAASSQQAMRKASEQLTKLIDDLIKQEMK